MSFQGAARRPRIPVFPDRSDGFKVRPRYTEWAIAGGKRAPRRGGDDAVTAAAPEFVLRPGIAADEDAVAELWRRTWQTAYPAIDFAARLAWWRERWNSELKPFCTILVAETTGDNAGRNAGSIIGFVTINERTGYLDQLGVAPEAWGGGAAATLLDAAKRVAPSGLDLHVNQDNRRAIRFYEKHGFVVVAADINPHSGAPIHKMSWRP
jgi:putative acetyltransferase